MNIKTIQNKNGNDLPMTEVLYENKYELSADTTVRRNAYQSFIQTLEQYKHTYAAVYATQVTKEVTMARVRGYDSVIDMLLQSHDVTKVMYENLLDIYYKVLVQLMHNLAKMTLQIH